MASRRSPLFCTAVPMAALAASLVLAGCSDSATNSSGMGHETGPESQSATASASASQGTHSEQDVSFAQEMIQHHRQAVAMAEAAPSRAESQEVKDLAAKIKDEQGPEVTTMSDWLRAWGEDVPDEDMSGHASTPSASSSSSMSGMTSDEDMKKLEKLSGTAFDRAFLEMMSEHHEGAVEMARTEQTKGSYGPARDLATSIVDSQTAELDRMKKLLDKE
ncbi:DUF305 domain-containing protein [Streptomyces minutiscleroticus]|uniref:DUF305 domain-containing protein n=1 Tax=Streptomyces minutiscleroticus TaxID=68238 RepID=UPI003320C166